MRTSNIPATLKYVRQKATEVHQAADTSNSGKYRKRMVRPTFVVDAANPKTLATATAWASGYQGKDNYDIIEVPNDPIEAVEIIGLDHRGRGGRAWKVLISNAYYVDLREDVFLECLVNGPGVEDGMLKGPFIWASSGNGLKLTRHNSRDHKKAVVMQERSPCRVKKSELVVGGIYETVAGTQGTFLGYVDFESVVDQGGWEKPGSLNYPYNQPSGKWLAKPQSQPTTKKYQLWYGGEWSKIKYDTARIWRLSELKDRAMAVKVGQVENLTDPLGDIRRAQLNLLNDELTELANRPTANPATYAYGCITDEERERQRMYKLVGAWKCCMYRRPGEPRPDVPELKELLDHPGVKEKL